MTPRPPHLSSRRTSRRGPLPRLAALAVVAGALATGLTATAAVPGVGAQGAEPATSDPAEVAVEAAAPANPVPSVPATMTLTSAQLGLGPEVSLMGVSTTKVLDVAVPEGLRPERLIATARTTAATGGGRLEARVGGVVVAVVDLAAGATPAGVTLDAPLGAAVVTGRSVTVELVARLDGLHQDTCSALLESPSVVLAPVQVAYTGQPAAPATISDFLPAVLTELDIVVPEPPTAQQVQAALRLGADVALLYGGQQPTVSVRGASQAAAALTPASPVRRTIVVAAGPASMSLGGAPGDPVLTVTGDEATLPQQVDLLTSQLARLPVAATAAVAQAPPVDQQLQQGRRTLASMGLGNLQGQALGRLDLAIPFSQSDLGGPSRAVVAHLSGTTTPIPDGGYASLSVLLNDVVIATQPLERSGAYSLRVALPDDQLRRDDRLVLRTEYVPAGGLCGAGRQPITVQVDPASRLEAQDGTSLPPGFTRFPQALLPNFGVALASLDLPSTQVATDLVVSMQRASSRLLRPDVRPWSAAITTNQPTLFVGQENAELDAALRPPVTLTGGRGVEATADRAQVQIGGSMAALEAFAVGGRDVMLATWQGDPSLLNLLVDRTAAGPGGWRSLEGDVIVQGAQGPPAPLSVRTTSTAAGPVATATATPESRSSMVRLAVLGVLALLVLVVAWVLWRRRRRAARAEAPPPPGP